MTSLKFPNLFKTNSTNVWQAQDYHKLTKQNTILLLQSERGELECDPYFGVMLKHYLYSQNNYVLKDILIDTLYTQIAIFIPQVRVDRNSIDLITDRERGKVYCSFAGVNQIDFQYNTYNLLLFEDKDI